MGQLWVQGAQCLIGSGVWSLQHQQLHDRQQLELQGSMVVVCIFVVFGDTSWSQQETEAGSSGGQDLWCICSQISASYRCVWQQGAAKSHAWWQWLGSAVGAGATAWSWTTAEVKAAGVQVHSCSGQPWAYMWWGPVIGVNASCIHGGQAGSRSGRGSSSWGTQRFRQLESTKAKTWRGSAVKTIRGV